MPNGCWIWLVSGKLRLPLQQSVPYSQRNPFIYAVFDSIIYAIQHPFLNTVIDAIKHTKSYTFRNCATRLL